ncbi:MAG: hypothetical protein ACM3YE_13585 [Bacteroidota bacterium]
MAINEPINETPKDSVDSSNELEATNEIDALIRDICSELDERMDNIKIYYPFLDIQRRSRLKNKARFELPELCMAVIAYLLNEGKLKYKGISLNDIANFIRILVDRLYQESIDETEAKDLASQVLDELQNGGVNFIFQYYSYAAGQPKEKMIKLIEMKLGENNQFYYYLTKQGLDFYLKTKEFPEETQITINLLLFKKQIEKGAFEFALETVKRLNMEVQRKIERKNWLLDLLMFGGKEGASAYREYHRSTFLQLDEEKQLFQDVRNLLNDVYMDYAGKMSQKNLTEKEKKAFILIKKIEKEMKQAMHAHTQLLKDAAALTSEYDRILKLRRKAAFSERFNFRGEFERVVAGGNKAEVLGFFTRPFLHPTLKKMFNPLKVFQPQRVFTGSGNEDSELEAEPGIIEKETLDEAVRKRVNTNFAKLAASFLHTLVKRKEFSLLAWCEELKREYGKNVFENPDFIAFIIELNKGKEPGSYVKRFSIKKITDAANDLSLLEEIFKKTIMEQRLKMEFDFIEVASFPDEDIDLDFGVKITNLAFRGVIER